MKCPNCKKEIENGSAFCEHCGTRVQKSKKGLWIMLSVIFMAAVVTIVVITVQEQIAMERYRVEQCQLELEQQLEAERQAKLEAERKAELARQEAERKAKLEAERKAELARQEAERKAREEAERKAEAERQAELVRQEAERKTKEAESRNYKAPNGYIKITRRYN